MELVAGETLRERMKSGRMTAKTILELAKQIAEALANAHEAGIVHRDLKPENLMITKDGLVKVLDFGLSKIVPSSALTSNMTTLPDDLTHPGTILGTVEYMSPEQAAGREITFLSDQFSFGSILYEMATGQQPFHRSSPVQTMAAIIEDQPVALAILNPELPDSFRRLIERCLAKVPEQRFKSTRLISPEIVLQRNSPIPPRWAGVAAKFRSSQQSSSF